MTEATRRIVMAAGMADEGISRKQLDLALEILGGASIEELAGMDRVMSASEVAAMLGCTKRSVENWVRQGYIRKTAIGGKGKILASSVIEAMKTGEARYFKILANRRARREAKKAAVEAANVSATPTSSSKNEPGPGESEP